MSDEERDESQDQAITGALRSNVANAFRTNRDEVTLRKMRTKVEQQLGLPEEFLKLDPYWNAHSKKIVLQEVDIQTANYQEPGDEISSPKKPARKVSAKPRAKKVVSEDEDEVKPKKRGRPPSASLTEKKKPTRIGKTKPTSEVKLVNKDATAAGEDSGELSDIPSDFYDTPIKKRRTSASKQKPKASPKAKKAAPEHVIEEDVIEEDETVEGNGVAAGGLSGNESEMSVLIDEEPPKKKPRARKAATGEPKKKAKTPVKAKPKKEKTPGKELSPDEERIKTLQGWLLKCGIRKFWSKELAGFDTPKEKINHLKSLLAEAGMTGQYSVAKAKKIKEDRELAAEVEWVQKSATDWGKEDDDERGITTRAGKSTTAPTPGRKLVQKSRGFEGLDFLDDQSDSD